MEELFGNQSSNQKLIRVLKVTADQGKIEENVKNWIQFFRFEHIQVNRFLVGHNGTDINAYVWIDHPQEITNPVRDTLKFAKEGSYIRNSKIGIEDPRLDVFNSVRLDPFLDGKRILTIFTKEKFYKNRKLLQVTIVCMAKGFEYVWVEFANSLTSLYEVINPVGRGRKEFYDYAAELFYRGVDFNILLQEFLQHPENNYKDQYDVIKCLREGIRSRKP